MSDRKLTLYTNRGTWAVRVHILARELDIDFEEVPMDLNVPRPDWYLKLNPLGKVPTITFDNEVMRESGVIVQYLSDLYPSHLVKRSDEEGGPLQVRIIGQTSHMSYFSSFQFIGLCCTLIADFSFPCNQRAQYKFFVDLYVGHIYPLMVLSYNAEPISAKRGLSENIVHAILKWLEPLLANANPYYGGSQHITLVEVPYQT